MGQEWTRRDRRIQTINGQKVESYEILAHLKLGADGIEHLAEIKPHSGVLDDVMQISTFDLIEVHEADADMGTFLASVNLTHLCP